MWCKEHTVEDTVASRWQDILIILTTMKTLATSKFRKVIAFRAHERIVINILLSHSWIIKLLEDIENNTDIHNFPLQHSYWSHHITKEQLAVSVLLRRIEFKSSTQILKVQGKVNNYTNICTNASPVSQEAKTPINAPVIVYDSIKGSMPELEA